MRKLLAIQFIILCSSITMFAQSKETPLYPKPFQFVLLDSVKGNKSDLFVKANGWLAKTFNSSKSVIQMSDKDAGKIIGKAMMTVPIKERIGRFEEFISYTITIDVKDGKYRCVLSDFYHDGGRFVMNGNKTGTYGSFENETARDAGSNATTKFNHIKDATIINANSYLESLKSAMHTTIDDF